MRHPIDDKLKLQFIQRVIHETSNPCTLPTVLDGGDRDSRESHIVARGEYIRLDIPQAVGRIGRIEMWNWWTWETHAEPPSVVRTILPAKFLTSAWDPSSSRTSVPRAKQLATSVAATALLPTWGSSGSALRLGSRWFISGSDGGRNTKIVGLGFSLILGKSRRHKLVVQRTFATSADPANCHTIWTAAPVARQCPVQHSV